MIKKQLGNCRHGCGSAALSGAKVTLPAIYSDNMVVQQSSTLKIPGKAAPGAKVTLYHPLATSARQRPKPPPTAILSSKSRLRLPEVRSP